MEDHLGGKGEDRSVLPIGQTNSKSPEGKRDQGFNSWELRSAAPSSSERVATSKGLPNDTYLTEILREEDEICVNRETVRFPSGSWGGFQEKSPTMPVKSWKSTLLCWRMLIWLRKNSISRKKTARLSKKELRGRWVIGEFRTDLERLFPSLKHKLAEECSLLTRSFPCVTFRYFPTAKRRRELFSRSGYVALVAKVSW